MDFTIQYFGEFDQLLHVEIVDASEMVEALDHARSVLKQPAIDGDPRPIGYVILDRQGPRSLAATGATFDDAGAILGQSKWVNLAFLRFALTRP